MSARHFDRHGVAQAIAEHRNRALDYADATYGQTDAPDVLDDLARELATYLPPHYRDQFLIVSGTPRR